MATYKDIQHLTGLSLSTISKYFNGAPVRPGSRSAIEAAVKRLDYRVNPAARSLRRGRSQSVGVLLPALDNQFHMAVIAALELALREAGMALLVSLSRPEAPGTAVEFLLDKGVDGIVAVPSATDEAALRSVTARTPLVLIDWLLPDAQVDAVTLDNLGAGRMAARHLIDHGHREIAVIGGPQDISSLRDRTAGFVAECERAGIALPPGRIVAVPLTIADGAEAAQQILFAPERPTAVFTANFELTVGTLQVVSECGLNLGEDVSMIGFDGAELAQLVRPRLTTIIQPVEALASAAAAHILAQMDQSVAAPKPMQLSARLLTGGSVRRL